MKKLLSIFAVSALGFVVVGCGSSSSEDAVADPAKALPVQGTPNPNKPVVGMGGAGSAPAGGTAPAAPATAPMSADK